ncbi:hypothetical protein VNO77_19941 [Canavalia gladiata]|uniref:Uncharacterized protein n=1 Tax=Canavalia gladiata TaxID=3824 RepID=A0AAN9LNM5_CANGL
MASARSDFKLVRDGCEPIHLDQIRLDYGLVFITTLFAYLYLSLRAYCVGDVIQIALLATLNLYLIECQPSEASNVESKKFLKINPVNLSDRESPEDA